jgi:tetratricopeptide (TPR) repeat protein
MLLASLPEVASGATPAGPPAARSDLAVPIVKQARERCGQAALEMVLRSYGADAAALREADRAYDPALRGSLITDLAVAARRAGYDAEIATLTPDSLVALLAAGVPPIVLYQGGRLPITARALRRGDGLGRGPGRLHAQRRRGAPARHAPRGPGAALADRRLAGADRSAEGSMSRSRDPRRSGAVVGLAVIVALAGCAHLVVLHDPLSADEHNDLGVVYETNGQPDLAAREYRKALRLDPHQARARVNLGNIEAAKGRWASAETCYRRALADSSTNCDAMNNLAVALLRQNRKLDEARALAARAAASGGERDSIYRATLAEVNSAAGGQVR